jgi:hypothetical protein
VRILTEKLVERAITIVEPSAEGILRTHIAGGLIWGPRWVEVRVKVPGIEKILRFHFGRTPKWDPLWGEEKDFDKIADSKLQVAEREGVATSIVVAIRPWALNEGEYLYSGGAARDGIYVAVSGAMGRTDEMIAEMIVSAIVGLVHLEADERRKDGKNQI